MVFILHSIVDFPHIYITDTHENSNLVAFYCIVFPAPETTLAPYTVTFTVKTYQRLSEDRIYNAVQLMRKRQTNGTWSKEIAGITSEEICKANA